VTTAPARDRWSSVHRLFDPLPRDLVAVVVAALGGAALALVTGTGGGTLRALAGFGFVLVLPGYALVAALFPGPPTRAVVEPDGFIRSLNVSYRRTGAIDGANVTRLFAYTDVDATTVERPAWVDREFNDTDDPGR